MGAEGMVFPGVLTSCLRSVKCEETGDGGTQSKGLPPTAAAKSPAGLRLGFSLQNPWDGVCRAGLEM